MIPFAEFAPDRPAADTAASVARNVVPVANGYAPFAELSSVTSGFAEPVKGAASYKDRNGVAQSFCGTPTRLFRLLDGVWVEVGSGYHTSGDLRWTFSLYGDYVVASNGADLPQKLKLGADARFSALAGAPPFKFQCIVRDFLFVADADNDALKVQWSGIDNPEQWEVGRNSSDFQILPNTGPIRGVSGGEYALVFTEFSIHRFTFVGGSAIFQRDEIESNHGLYAPGSLVKYSNLNFYLSHNGFYVTDGSTARPIGGSRVDAYFFEQVAQEFRFNITAAIDPRRKLYLIAYPSEASASGVCDKGLIYNWEIDRWAECDLAVAQLISGFQEGRSLDAPVTGSDPANLEAAVRNFDDEFWRAGAFQISAIDTAGRYCFFTGSPKAAALETVETQISPQRRSFVRGFHVVGQCAGAVGRVLHRPRLAVGYDQTPLATQDDQGYICGLADGRFIRAQVNVPAGQDWSFLQGIEPDFSAAGWR
jgi:hypothetical protein